MITQPTDTELRHVLSGLARYVPVAVLARVLRVTPRTIHRHILKEGAEGQPKKMDRAVRANCVVLFSGLGLHHDYDPKALAAAAQVVRLMDANARSLGPTEREKKTADRVRARKQKDGKSQSAPGDS